MPKLNPTILIKKLEQEGYTQVRVCPIPPNKDLPEHTHDEHTVHIILNGELTIRDKTGTKTYKPGDRVEFAAGTTHKARGNSNTGTMIIGVKNGGITMTKTTTKNKVTTVETQQKIIPHLWFDKEAKEAVKFYTSIFPKSKVTNTTTIHNTPSGDCDIVSFELAGYKFMAISAGPYFKINPSISFILNFDPGKDKNAKKNLDTLWKHLSQDGKALMPLDKYPFSDHYGWIQDKYGISWQLMLTNPTGEERPFITPAMMFTKSVCGKAEEATQFYQSVFKNTKQGIVARYPKGMAPDKESTIMYTDFMLEGQWFVAMDSGRMHDFAFNEGVSLIVRCDTQAEIDYYWKKLSADPKSEQCGWLKDMYGVSWQIVPVVLDTMMQDKDKKKVDRVTQAFLKMKKFEIKALEKAYKGNRK